jgi:hypothetical protein
MPSLFPSHVQKAKSWRAIGIRIGSLVMLELKSTANDLMLVLQTLKFKSIKATILQQNSNFYSLSIREQEQKLILTL